MNREVRDNLYNQHSSRGHSIFQITLRKNIVSECAPASGNPGKGSPSKDELKRGAAGARSRLSRLFFVDLA